MAEEAVQEFSEETKKRVEMLMGLTLKDLVELRDCLKAHGVEPAAGGAVFAGAMPRPKRRRPSSTSFWRVSARRRSA
jgi:hypothetical protein